VLTIGKLSASVDQLGYYEQQVAQGMEDYFSGRGEAPGRWLGGGCGGLGVSGQVDRDVFMRAMDGCDPGTGERLRPEHGRTKVAAFDLTFSAPKSVSVLFAIADEETSGALLEAHERSVHAAFAYVEREACFTRRGQNGIRRVRGEGFLAAACRHRLSRAGDAQLHTHVVVANMTRAEGAGRRSRRTGCMSTSRLRARSTGPCFERRCASGCLGCGGARSAAGCSRLRACRTGCCGSSRVGGSRSRSVLGS
jgi:conjugative relaxase-like TrwC/TraI family protein